MEVVFDEVCVKSWQMDFPLYFDQRLSLTTQWVPGPLTVLHIELWNKNMVADDFIGSFQTNLLEKVLWIASSSSRNRIVTVVACSGPATWCEKLV